MVDAGDLSLAVYTYGPEHAPPLLLLHGFLSTGTAWHDVAVALSDSRRIFAPDQRGRGMSQHAPDGDYSTEAYVRDAEGLVKAFGISRMALIGHSMGGNVAITFANKHPGLVSSLVAVDMAPETVAGAATQVQAGIAALGRTFDTWDRAREWQRTALPDISEAAVERRLGARFVERNGRIEWRQDPAILEYQQRHTPTSPEDRWGLLKGVRCRTLFLLGGKSGLVTDDVATRAAATVPDGEWVRIDDAGHNVFEDNPANSIRSLRKFLANDPA